MLGYNKILEKLSELDKELDKIENNNNILNHKFDLLMKRSTDNNQAKPNKVAKKSDKYTLIDEDHNFIGKFNTLAKMANELNISLSMIYNHLDHSTNIVDLSDKVKNKRGIIRVNLIDKMGKVNKTLEYGTIKEAANELGISTKTLYNHKKYNKVTIPMNTPKKGTNASAISVQVNLLNSNSQVVKTVSYNSLSQAVNDLDISWGTLYKYLDKDAGIVAIPMELTSKSIKPQLFHIEG